MLKMYVWSVLPKFLAVAQANSVAEARNLLLQNNNVGESGDGSCPERDAAREHILSNTPFMWHGPNAEFALTDSAELREQEDYSKKLFERVESLRAELAAANTRIATLEAELAAAEGSIASATDIANTWAREVGAQEDFSTHKNELALCDLIDRVWAKASGKYGEALDKLAAAERGRDHLAFEVGQLQRATENPGLYRCIYEKLRKNAAKERQR